ncbi:MAG TPA: fibronectin type III domain-containing protein, partial [Pseudonocardiaceae bacterium]|nr:fibronectin type III domain-containing protein [Pseudonocardiaceae bacterium]
VAGDTIAVRVPMSGADPDGDSVAVTGIGSATQLGRVLGSGATTIEYQAYPTSAGSDSLTYRVTDRYGAIGEATIRIAVVPPGEPQPAVAVDDVLTAAPGARLTIDLLANDLYGVRDPVETAVVGDEPDEARVAADGRAEVTAPDLTGKPLVVPYSLTGGLGAPSLATLTVRSREGHTVPPVAGDAVAERPAPGETTVTVDVLARSGDQDGEAAKLELTRVFDPDASIDGPNVVLPATNVPRAIAYEIADGDGATAVGLVHVPAVGGGAPYVKPDTVIEVPVDGSVTVALADHVVDPAGKPLSLTTTDRIWASPSAGLAARDASGTELEVTGRGGYTGPAAITFEVTNGMSITDPAGVTTVLTIPVQVGPDTPVLRCPGSSIGVIAGGEPVEIDVTSVCHVWVADPANLDGLRYTAAWRDAAAGVDVAGSGSRAVTITASGSATPGTSGVVDIGVEGFDGAGGQLAVRVLAAPPPSIAPVTVDGVKAGDTATVGLAPYIRSRLRDPALSVLGVTQKSGMGASASADGTVVRLTPAADAHGTMTFTVVATDVADQARTDRRATGLITLRVLGVPDAPGTPAAGRTVLSKVVELSWSTPANNGAPIEVYEVDYGSGTQTCAASPCTIGNLRNGEDYTFRVRARNLVGWGEYSAPSAPAQPNTVPGAVTGLAASDPEDGRLRLTWNEPPNEGTPVQRYEVSWTGGGRATATGTSLEATGLDNESRYTFTVIAVNSQGPGPAATVDAQSAGAPAAPEAPTFTATNLAGSTQRAVRVSWAGVSPNGPGPTMYTLSRVGGSGAKTVCTNVTATACADDGLANDGTIYTYTVTAANQAAVAQPAGHTSPPSAGARMEATATPDAWGPITATATGNDGEAQLQFDVPASHGAQSIVQCRHTHGSCGDWTGYPTGGQGGVQRTVTGLPNGAATTFTLTLCNGGGGSDAYAGNPCNAPGASNAITAYGPIRQPSASAAPNGPNVNWSVSVDPNGKPATVSIQTSAGRNETFTTGVGVWSRSGTDSPGYNSDFTITITVSDPGRATMSASASTRTPPPPPEVRISKGAGCQNVCGGGSFPLCTHPSCAYIHVQTINFPSSVTCTFTSQMGGGFVNQTFAANDNKDSWNWYGYPNTWVQVTCGGVTARMTWY